MWVVSGPFDGDVAGDVSFQKTKLLKPNTAYAVGRKGQPLLVNNKKISHEHCQIIVGPHSSDDARDPNKRPTLEIINTTKKNVSYAIKRKDGMSVQAQPDVRTPVEDGESLQLIISISIHFEWRPVCAYASPSIKPPISIDACAALGIKLVHTLQENITHHLASHYIANLPMAASLLALSRIVKPEWLVEVLRLGNLPRSIELEQSGGTSLEDHFILPQEAKYRPAFSPSLLASQKAFDIWEPNEERVNFFSSLRFLCLYEKVTQLGSELREAIHRGGGTLEMFDIHSGAPKFRKALTRSQAKAGKQTVVVGDVDAMQAAVGTDGWAQIVAEARSFGLDIFSPSKIVQSVLKVDLALLKSNGTNADEALPSSPLPDVGPNSIPEEQTVHPEPGPSSEATAPPRRKLVRRVTSREPSMPPPPPPTTSDSALAPEAGSGESAAPPRRMLTRRLIGGQPVVTGLDDPSTVLDKAPDLDESGEIPSLAAALARAGSAPGRRLKRRVGVPGAGASTLTSEPDTMMSGLEETFGGEEPPLKKFKALFEASNLEAASGSGALAAGTATADSFEMVDSLAPFAHSQSQTQTEAEADTQSGAARQGALRNMGVSSLAVLREEEEETQSTVHPLPARARKRRLDAVDEDAEMDVNADGGAENGALHAAKKRAVENVNAVDRTGTQVAEQQQREKVPGAQPGQPDTDAAFLKALASTKRGKKAEDEFDREFNKLKISKPKGVDEELDARREREEEEWAVLAEFGDDEGLRGNFMVVVEMEVYKRDKDGEGNVNGRRSGGNKNPAWDGRPNFKKFKQKFVGPPRAKIELFISDDNDYGMGSAYWKGGSSQTQTQNAYRDSQMDFQSQSQSQSQLNYEGSRKSRSQQPVTAADSDDEIASQPTKSRKPPSKAEFSPAAGKSQRATAKNKARSQSKPAGNPLFLDSDDDGDEDNFRGFGDEDDHPPNRRGNTQAPVDDEQTLRSSAGMGAAKATSSKAATKTRAATGATRKSTRTTSTKTVAKKAAPVIADDDSDDGAVFRGF